MCYWAFVSYCDCVDVRIECWLCYLGWTRAVVLSLVWMFDGVFILGSGGCICIYTGGESWLVGFCEVDSRSIDDV